MENKNDNEIKFITLTLPPEIVKKIGEAENQRKKSNYEGAKEAFSQNIDYHNSTLNLIYGLLLGIFSFIFIQSAFGIFTEIIKKGYLLFSYILLSGISVVILAIVSWILIESIKQTRRMMNYHQKKADYLSEGLMTHQRK